MDLGTPETQHAFESLGISLGLGLLVGLQRERAGSRIAGVRTFPLISLLGTLSALLSLRFGGGWVVGAALVGLVLTVVAANMLALKQDGVRGAGLTTEVSIVLMFVLGAYAAVGPPAVVLAVGGTVAVLLFLKGGLHGLAAKIGDKDMRAIMLFVAIAFVILPVLPDESYGPLGVWNPRHIWWVVVLVSGIGLGGYVAYKFFGGTAGTVLAGILGGSIASTATTVSYAKRAADGVRESGNTALIVIVIASTVTYVRVMFEIAVIAPEFSRVALGPLIVMAVVGALVSLGVWLSLRSERIGVPEQENPTQLRFAMVFAAVFALILLAAEVARAYFGAAGTYAVAAIAGTVNLDAITLSNAQLVSLGRLDGGLAWRAVLVAAIANLLFKLGAVAVLGPRRLLWMLGAAFAVHIAAAAALILWWPDGLVIPAILNPTPGQAPP